MTTQPSTANTDLRGERDGTHNPHIKLAIDTLKQVWSGEYDITDTCVILRRESDRLNALADAMEMNDS